MAKVIWLTGISSSGKTTIGKTLKEKLETRYCRVELLDGDNVRDFFENDLGYTRQERILNVKRIAFAAMMIAKHGTSVIVANIAPYYEVRDFIRRQLKEYVQVYLKVSTEAAMARDVKGHYARYARGEMKNIIGLDDKYDVPRTPDIVIDTEQETIDGSVNMILDYLKGKEQQKNVEGHRVYHK